LLRSESRFACKQTGFLFAAGKVYACADDGCNEDLLVCGFDGETLDLPDRLSSRAIVMT